MFELDDKNKKIYKILSNKNIIEQNIEMVELEHNITKAKILLMICDDENRVFNIAFKTPVNNSKGIPHILEHSVLCGSKKYNVKDPFIELAKGSLNTFLNAMTFPDKTCYPVASANIKDFHNLVDVYLDAVFYPNVCTNKKIFEQEGWHYEISDKNSELKVNGVVYNEMRGVYSDPDSLLETEILETLYKNTNYQYESGGNPKEIINLSYDEFLDFHKKYYSPTNAIIIYYGRLNYNEELEYLNREYLSKFDYVNCNVTFDVNNNYKNKEEKISFYNSDTKDTKNKSYVSYSFSIDDKKTTIDNIILQVIDYVLFSSDGAILKEKFLNEGYGESVYTLYESELKKGFYSIISQNIDISQKEEFINKIDIEFQNIITSGIDSNKIKAALNSIHFDYIESEYKKMPRGLCLSLTLLGTYLYGEDYSTFIEYEEAFKKLESVDLNDKNNIFISTIKRIFIDNNHKCINVLNPKYGLSKENEKNLNKQLSERKSKMSDAEIEEIIKSVIALKKYQETGDKIEDLKCIPLLKISDIERDKNLIDYIVKKYNGIATIISHKNDKHIVYCSINFDLTDLSKEEIYVFSLIINLLSKIDLKNETYYDFNNYIDLNTGGLQIDFVALEKKVFLSLGIKVIDQKLGVAFDIFNKLITEIVFLDKKRIQILINEKKSNALTTLLSAGHIASMNRAKSIRNFTSWYLDKINDTGIASYLFFDKLSQVYDNNSDLINTTMQILYRKITTSKMYFDVCANEKYDKDVENAFATFCDKYLSYIEQNKIVDVEKEKLLNNLNKLNDIFNFDDFDMKSKAEAIITPNDINFCALTGNFDKNEYTGRLNLLRTMFNYEYLWTNIRVLGGAYGCFSIFTKDGNYAFASYRDPNIVKTNEIFIGVKKFLVDNEKEFSEIEKYIIGTMGAFDNPISIVDRHKRNVAAYFNNVSNEKINDYRHSVLDTKPNDIIALAKIFDNIENDNCKCALISSNNIDEAKKEYNNIWQLIK